MIARAMWRLQAAALALQVWAAFAKVQVTRVTFGGGADERGSNWQYAAKFGFGLGTSSYRVRVREVYPRTLGKKTLFHVEPYLDEDWHKVDMVEDECRRSEYAKKRRAVRTGANGTWGDAIKGTIAQNVRSHVWYFALSACDSAPRNGTHVFEFELEARQEGGSHFSIESQWAPHSSVLTLLGCSAFLLHFWRRSCMFMSNIGYLHPVILTLACVVVTQYIAQILHIIHLYIYQANGQGSHVVEVLAEVLFTSSQVAQTSLMIIIAMGYTLTRSKLGDLRMFLPVCTLVAVGHIVLVVLDKTQDDASHRFSEHEGLKGWTFLLLRLALYAWFCIAVRATANESGLKVRAFLNKFQLVASLYFLAYPAAFFIVPAFAPYLRKPIMEFGLVAAQVCSNVWLASLFLGRGAYFEASSLSASPLPGGSRSPPRFFKDD